MDYARSQRFDTIPAGWNRFYAMNRSRGFLFLLTALAFVAGPPAWGQDAGSSEDGRPPEAVFPNIVFILVDDLGWSDLPAYGNGFHETPHIDRLAAEGMRFTDAYAAAPVCSPTRASIQSGQYPARVGITDFIPGHWRPYERVTVPTNRTQHLPLDVVTVGETLREAGYATGYFGKWHLGGGDHGPEHQGYEAAVVHRGWGHFELGDKLFPPQEVDSTDYLADVLAERGAAFMEAHQGEPFFLTISHFAVHIPLEAEDALIAKYEGKPKPEVGPGNPIYAAMVEHVDRSVGRVLGALDSLGLADNTVVVFYSDNGGLIERFDQADGVVVSTNAPLRSEKGTLYEGGIREPLIVRWPGVAETGATSATLMTSPDLLPTFAEIAGAALPEGQTLDGISLVPVLRGEEPDTSRAIYWHYPHYHHAAPAGAVREGDYKLIEFYDDGHLELYNLAEDVGETNNLADVMPEVAEALQAKLAAWRQDVGAEMPTPNPDFDVARRAEWGTHPDRQ